MSPYVTRPFSTTSAERRCTLKLKIQISRTALIDVAIREQEYSIKRLFTSVGADGGAQLI
jgi:hypothetical protein